MRRCLFAIVFAVIVPAASAATSCESLASLTLPDTTITAAQSVAQGVFSAPAAGRGRGAVDFKTLPAFCRVDATVKPTSDSDIKMEVWLPASGWNGKFEANGNGGWSGSIAPGTLAAGLRLGYATGMTDTGHEGGSAEFAMGHPEKVIDFAYRAVHELTVKAKAIVAAYYGQPAKLSYWNGCSAGGREAMMEAQRFPEDYDGIIAGSPALNTSGRAIQSLWVAQAVHKDEASFIPPAKFPVIHNAVLAACDALDGVKDGILEDPTRCKFDPKELECKGADGAECLTAPQVETARTIYSPVLRLPAKTPIFSGPERGSELGWTTMAGPQPFRIGVDYFRYLVFQNPDWDYRTLNFNTDIALADKLENDRINARNPDLKAFFAHGGKLLHYHGWSDPQISPGSSANYYRHVLDTMGGASKVRDNYRLFMVPGMAHCGGGEGTSSFNMLSALEQWVEQKKAPDQILASRIRDGKVDRTRPLCPYPRVAAYKGTGSTDDAANFACKLP